MLFKFLLNLVYVYQDINDMCTRRGDNTFQKCAPLKFKLPGMHVSCRVYLIFAHFHANFYFDGVIYCQKKKKNS